MSGRPPPGPHAELETVARRGRWLVISTVAGSGGGHVGGPLSVLDLLVALFFRVLRIRPNEPGWPDRDRFILSKGHSSVGLYAVMAMRGYLPVEELRTFDKGDSRLQTGSLGQGLAVGVGIALGARLRGRGFHTFVMLGDGECQEGMVWESVNVAVRYGLGNLTAIVDQNGLQQYGWPLPDNEAHPRDRADPWPGTGLGAVFEACGWRTVEIDGHDFAAIVAACEGARAAASGGRPTALLARTVKGRGLSFTEGRHNWHSRVATAAEVEQARLELGIDERGEPR